MAGPEIGPPPPSQIPPQSTGVVELPPPPRPPIDPPAAVGVSATGSGAGGSGAGVVGFFAIFGAVIGLNNTKKEADVPLAAILEETESGASAFINPTFLDQADAAMNIANGQ